MHIKNLKDNFRLMGAPSSIKAHKQASGCCPRAKSMVLSALSTFLTDFKRTFLVSNCLNFKFFKEVTSSVMTIDLVRGLA